jgi:SAM-dependent methyltransferase
MSDEHAFTAVDDQSDPKAWVDVLDRMRSEPAYAAYKTRLAALLEPQAGGRYLEVGTGTGDDALALAARFGAGVVGVDASATMIEEAKRRGLTEAHVADAHALPFADESFDGAWADRTFQHLADPEAALRELVRVTNVGGRIALADPDYETQVVSFGDRELARRVLRFRADHALRNGTLAHRMVSLFGRADLDDIAVEATTVVSRDPEALDHAMGLRSWAETAHERGLLAVGDVAAWERAHDDAVRGGSFLYAFTIFLTAGTRR